MAQVIEVTEVETRNRPAMARATTVAMGPAYQAYLILYAGFVALPILAGLDKFLSLLVNWEQYLAPLATQIVPVTPHTTEWVCRRKVPGTVPR